MPTRSRRWPDPNAERRWTRAYTRQQQQQHQPVQMLALGEVVQPVDTHFVSDLHLNACPEELPRMDVRATSQTKEEESSVDASDLYDRDLPQEDVVPDDGSISALLLQVAATVDLTQFNLPNILNSDADHSASALHDTVAAGDLQVDEVEAEGQSSEDPSESTDTSQQAAANSVLTLNSDPRESDAAFDTAFALFHSSPVPQAEEKSSANTSAPENDAMQQAHDSTDNRQILDVDTINLSPLSSPHTHIDNVICELLRPCGSVLADIFFGGNLQPDVEIEEESSARQSEVPGDSAQQTSSAANDSNSMEVDADGSKPSVVVIDAAVSHAANLNVADQQSIDNNTSTSDGTGGDPSESNKRKSSDESGPEAKKWCTGTSSSSVTFDKSTGSSTCCRQPPSLVQSSSMSTGDERGDAWRLSDVIVRNPLGVRIGDGGESSSNSEETDSESESECDDCSVDGETENSCDVDDDDDDDAAKE